MRAARGRRSIIRERKRAVFFVPSTKSSVPWSEQASSEKRRLTSLKSLVAHGASFHALLPMRRPVSLMSRFSLRLSIRVATEARDHRQQVVLAGKAFGRQRSRYRLPEFAIS